MALCLREFHDYQKSIEIFTSCINDHEKHQSVGLYDYLHRGVTKLMMKDYNGAIADLLKEITIYNKLADTYYYLAEGYFKINQKRRAKYYLKRAYELYTKTGYHRNDSYCEEPDQIYLSDIVKSAHNKNLD
jgi:tetratricopeptide (TPR) repeat protein